MKENAELNTALIKVEQLFRKYYKGMCLYATHFVQDKSIAENIVQDVFFEVWQHRERVEFEGSVKYYLFRSVYNKSLNYLQSHAYIKQTSLEEIPEKIEGTYEADFLPEQEHRLMMEELEAQIEAIIESLPQQCRVIFRMSRVEQLKNREIAEKLNLSVKSVEKHISKALTILRTHLKGRELLLLLYLFNL
ncbi:MAG: RNA polymerase sigma-70 factor [Tannerellaceae bacterium]|nr:RNA polymerase sigma-70 factor [Tannerellaceae bacterium]